MAVPASRERLEPHRQWRDREMSPERTKVWKEPKPRKVPVVYYLSRHGHLEHPHFMEVTLSSTDGLYLRDVFDRFNFLRGKGTTNLYSWSSKRSYKNGFVWQDLSEDDLIHPVHGHEYVLKGSELLRPFSFPRSQDTTSALNPSDEIRRNSTPWGSLDFSEHKVRTTDSKTEAAVTAADASTQTEEGRRRRRTPGDRAEIPRVLEVDPPANELDREEISPPPPSTSSTETLDTLIKADGPGAVDAGTEDQERSVVSYGGGRMRASAMLMHVLSCGSINVKDQRGGLWVTPPPGKATPPPGKATPRGRSDVSGGKEMDNSSCASKSTQTQSPSEAQSKGGRLKLISDLGSSC